MAFVLEDSFEEYVRASGPRLKRLAFLLTGDLTEAEDLLQSAYAEVMPHWGKVSGYDVPDAYMRRNRRQGPGPLATASALQGL